MLCKCWDEGAGGFGFAAEALQSPWIIGQFYGKELQGYAPIEPKVFGFVHHAHTALAQL
jgi:hypothetical protein